MRIVHTSDWHLGHRLYEQSQYEEQELFLAWLADYIDNNHIDLLIIAGDVFDTGNPSNRSQKLYYDFLIKLYHSHCSYVIITGGNHDAPGTLNAPQELLNALSIKVIGKATTSPADELFRLSIADEELIIAAVPYLRDQDIRRAVAGESFDQIGERYKQALVNHYHEVAQCAMELSDKRLPIIATGHLFALGCATSDSEQSIYVGNLGYIGAQDFPECFDYIALGHLHRSQTVGKSEHIRYSGSPIMLSFSEINHRKAITVLETTADSISHIQQVEIPQFRELLRITGDSQSCIAKLQEIAQQNYNLPPWVDVVLTGNENSSVAYAEIRRAAENLRLEVLRTTLQNPSPHAGLEEHLTPTAVKELTPLEVFELKCRESKFDLDSHPEIVDAFHEALQLAREAP